MSLRKSRKIEMGSSNLAGKATGREARLNPSDPGWLDIFSLPREVQHKILTRDEIIRPDPFASAVGLYHSRGSEAGHINPVETHLVTKDLADQSQYATGQSSLGLDYVKGLFLIQQLPQYSIRVVTQIIIDRNGAATRSRLTSRTSILLS